MLIEILRRIAGELFPEVYLLDPTEGYTDQVLGDALGIIIQPGPHTTSEYGTLALTNTEEVANLWGHTALYLRRNGRIVRSIGFDPNRLLMFSPLGLRISSGTGGTTGHYYDETAMFRSPDALILEFPIGIMGGINAFHLDELLQILPLPGRGTSPHNYQHRYLTTYVTRDGERYRGAYDNRIMGNCINSVVQVLTRSNLVLTFQGQDLQSAQGRLTRNVLRQPNQFALHDLDFQAIATPHRHGTLMPLHRRVLRRAGGLVTMINVAWLALQLIRRVRNPPSWLSPAYLSLLNLMISFLIEAVPSNSRLWRLPTQTLQMIVAMGAKAFLLLSLYRNTPSLIQGTSSYLFWINRLWGGGGGGTM